VLIAISALPPLLQEFEIFALADATKSAIVKYEN